MTSVRTYTDWKPTRKVTVPTLAGAVVTVLSHFAGWDLPTPVAVGMTVILTFALGYLVPEKHE